MHLSEFKAWFLGYTEEMASQPNKAQWAKIKKRVNEISNDYTPAPVFIQRYWEPYRPYWGNNIVYCGSMSATSTGAPVTTSNTAIYNLTTNDWTEAGRAEFKAEAA
jgi:hypothetical protein